MNIKKPITSILALGLLAAALPMSGEAGESYSQDYQCNIDERGEGDKIEFWHELDPGIDHWGVETHPFMEGDCKPHLNLDD